MTAPDQLRGGLAALAEQAENYADADAALHRLSSRRRRRGAVVAAAAAVLLLSVATFWFAGRPRAVQPPVTPASSAPVPAVPYPATVDPPARPARDLPRDRAVGVASLVYQPCTTCRPNLVMPDGTQYRLSTMDLSPISAVAGLSPDGRWLLTRGGSAAQIRDLTGTTSHPIGDASRVVDWSPDSRWVLSVLGDDAGRQVTDLSTGKTTPVDPGTLAVLEGGNLLMPDGVARNRRMPVRVLDRAGNVRRHFVLDAGRALHGREDLFTYDTDRAHGTAILTSVGVGAGTIMMRVYNADHESVVLFSSRDGSLLRRLDMPPHTTNYTDWTVVAFDGTSLVAQYQPLSGPSAGRRQWLYLIDPGSGARREVCSLPFSIGASIMVRGARSGI
jgi:hypothetical protein